MSCELPGGWRQLKLGAVCSLRGGSAFPQRYQGGSEGRFPFIKVSDLALAGNESAITRANNWVSGEVTTLLKARPLPPGTVVFAKIGEALKAGRFRRLTQETLIDNNMMGATARPGTDERFLLYLLAAAGLPEHAAGSALPYLRASDLTEIPVRVPPQGEQRRIASVLAALDDKIARNRRVTEVTDEMVGEVYRHRFGRRDEVGDLSSYATLAKHTVQPSSEPEALFEHFSIPAFDAGQLPELAAGSSMLSGKTLLPIEQCVLFSKLNPATKRVWWPAPSGAGTAVCSPELLALVPATDAVPASFLYSLCAFDERFYSSVLASATGTTGSRQRVRPSEVLACPAPLLSPEELTEWNAFAEPLIRRAAAARSECRTLTALRDALLPKLVSGEIRVAPDADDDPGELAA